DFRAIPAHLGRETPAPGDELLRRELIGARGGALDQIGDAVARAQQLALLRRVQLSRREPGGVQRGPETVSRTREVMPGGAGIEARVDAAEQHFEPGRDDVAQRLAAGVLELGGARPAG